jgi:outer membrane protein assembly factor BamB
MKITFSLTCVCLTVSLVFAEAEDWPSLRGPFLNGVSKAAMANLEDDPEILWKVDGPGGNASLVLVDGLAYTYGTKAENVLCLDAANGKKVWSHSVDEWYGQQTPTVANGKLFIHSYTEKTKVWCFDAKSGDVIWEKDLPNPEGERNWGQAGSPLVVGGMVIFNCGEGVAMDCETGDFIWKFEGLPGMATPVLFKYKGKDAVALFVGTRLVARDLKSGDELWSIPWKTNSAVNAHLPLIFDEKVLINSGYGLNPALYDFSSGAPALVWAYEKRQVGYAFAGSVMHDGLIYGFFDNALACLDPMAGSLRWRESGSGSVLLIDGKLLWLSERGEMKIAPVSAKGFESVVTAQVHGGITRNNPAYVDGKLFVKNDKGSVVCVKVADAK